MDIYDSDQLLDHLRQLPYGRNSDRADYSLIIDEEKGTCATKHAFFKQVAIENGAKYVQLFIGIYAMNGDNTKGIQAVLDQYGLDHLPEAHTYLKIDGTIVDVTSTVQSTTSFTEQLLYEEEITPEQIGNHKVNLHRDFMRNWAAKNPGKFDFETLWEIREKCILALSNNQS